MVRRRARSGFTIICVLMALAIIGILTQQYFGADAPGAKPWVVTQMDRTRNAAMLMNLRSAETQFYMKTEGRELPINELRKTLDGMANLAGSGRLFLKPDKTLENTVNIQTKKFADEYPNLPRIR